VTTTEQPSWTRNAIRVDRPDIDIWYKPEEHAAIDGVLIWRGQMEQHQTGETYNAYAIRQANTTQIIGVSERAGLRGMRTVALNSRVFIRPTTIKDLSDGRKMQQFEIIAERLEPLTDPAKKSRSAISDDDPSSTDGIPF
jgi:hypothetical protein